MSNYGAPFGDDSELERQLQEEYRRRQVLQQGGAGLALQQQHMLSRGGAAAGGRDPYSAFAGAAYGGYSGMGQGQQQAAAASAYQHGPYTQVTNPYSGLAEARAAYARGNLAASAAGGGAADNDTPSAQAMYAQQLQQQQRRAYPSQHQQQQSQQQQQMYAYGSSAQQQRSAAAGMDPYSYGAGVSGGGGMPPYRDYAPAPTSHLLAQQQQQQQHQLDPSDPYGTLRANPNPRCIRTIWTIRWTTTA